MKEEIWCFLTLLYLLLFLLLLLLLLSFFFSSSSSSFWYPTRGKTQNPTTTSTREVERERGEEGKKREVFVIVRGRVEELKLGKER